MKQSTEQGFALIMVMVLLAIMLIGALAMLRSSDASARVAGNISFQAAATKATDIGISEAARALDGMANTDVDIANTYFATRQPENGDGILSTVDWREVASTEVGNYSVRRVIERMCQTTPVTDPTTQCMMYEQSSVGSNKAGALAYANPASLYYRITVRVTGPNNTTSFVQALVSK
jgi:Tfp pilus assembly protein PilX